MAASNPREDPRAFSYRPTDFGRFARLQYLGSTVSSIVTRAAGIIELAEMDQLHSQQWNRDLVDEMLYVADTLEIEQALIGETEEQKQQRHRWILQTKAIEFLTIEPFSQLSEKRDWKTELALEVLAARQQYGSDLPGITVAFREPYNNYLDQFSRNPLFIFFEGQAPLYKSPDSTLRIHRTVNDLIEKTHDIHATRNLLAGAKALPENPLLWTAMFIDELAYMLGAKANQPDDIPVHIHLIRKRMHFLKELIEGKKIVRKRTRAELLLNDKYTAFKLIVVPEEESGREFSVQIQPEEVTDEFWNLLRDLNGDPDIPSREECIPLPYQGKSHQRRYRK